jgi:hypothetical protein
VTREDIIGKIWGKDVFVDTDSSINGAIRKTRRALRDDPENPLFVQTVTGKGYRFIATVTDARAPAQYGGADNGANVHAIEPDLVISHYRIEEKIASGGMGDVFQAQDIRRMMPCAWAASSASVISIATARIESASIGRPAIRCFSVNPSRKCMAMNASPWWSSIS